MELPLIWTISYAAAALINGLLLVLLAVSWRGRTQGSLLLAAIFIGLLGSLASMLVPHSTWLTQVTVLKIEGLKQGAWALFFIRLLVLRTGKSALLQSLAPAAVVLLVAANFLILKTEPHQHPYSTAPLPLLLGTIYLIWLIEQLYRNSSTPDQWAIKYLCFGVGSMAIFDAVLFIDALLFNQINPEIWAARGFVQAIATPLIAISATRNPDWEVKVFISRRIVFFTSSLMATGGYLLLVAGAGYFLKIYGGDWGDTLLASLLFGAVLALLILLSSAQLRGQLKQFIARNFYRNKYEYRDEWLKLTGRLATKNDSSPNEVALTAIRELLESSSGAIWVTDLHNHCRQSSYWEWPEDNTTVKLDRPELLERLQHGEIINLARYNESTDSNNPPTTTELPPALTQGNQPWLLIPLNIHGSLQAIIQVGHSHSLPTDLDWEDTALVSAASQQVASYLAFHRTKSKLAEAQQFEAYNRLSAFLIHDLKNVIAQLQMVVQNSKKHADNPDFIRDAFSTIENAVNKMNSMQLQLRKRHTTPEVNPDTVINLRPLLNEILSQSGTGRPVPSIEFATDNELFIRCNHERLLNVLLHIIQNAKDATETTGQITITIANPAESVEIEVVDSGCGMDRAFIKNELFRPFKTTKGNAGMGIGVFESKEYIESIGGQISVISEVGNGTAFKIRLPQIIR